MKGASRKHDPEGSRAAILDAAEQSFLARGFAGASMSEIAKASGVTKSLIHHHFGSKEALWREVKRRRFAGYFEQQMALFASGGPSAALLRESMRVYLQFLRDNPDTVRLMSWLQLEGDRDVTQMVGELRDAGIDHVRSAQEAGVLRKDVPAPFVLMTFLGLVNAWFDDPANDDATAEAYLDCAWALFSGGLLRAAEPRA
ncbi:MAG: TetR/AcrR family transcriptional regulator [Myxococcales bacterium]|nr:TetR/AcrR family transcriptional regulator [Myxococcales bacterium]MCB9713467.1 TetR/AcrR family transcriptional regulator [Myxococcales bacterium]